MWQVHVPPEIAALIRQHCDGRDALLAVLNRLHDLLRTNPEQFQQNRDPSAPDTSFIYTHTLFVGGRWKTFTFSVCDTIAPGRLLLESLVVS